MRITEPKCLQRKHKHSSAKVTHSGRDKGAGIFLRKRLINLCFLSVSLSEKAVVHATSSITSISDKMLQREQGPRDVKYLPVLSKYVAGLGNGVF